MSTNNTMYNLALDTISGMGIGDVATIEIPADLGYFRKYLSEISKRHGKRFTTSVKAVPGKLQIMRIKYSNIHSQELE